MIPGKMVTGMGGAMDILAGTKKVIIATTFAAKNGTPKIMKKCTLPYTALRCVTKVVTEKCIMEICGGRFRVVAMYPGVTKEELSEQAEAELVFADEMGTMIK